MFVSLLCSFRYYTVIYISGITLQIIELPGVIEQGRLMIKYENRKGFWCI